MTQRSEGGGRGRAMLAAGWIVIVLAATTVPVILLWHRLPDPVATHWKVSGRPDGSMSRIWGLGLFNLIWIVVAVAFLARAAFRPLRTGRTGLVGGLLGLLGGITIGVQALVLWSNIDRGSWRDARPVGWLPAVALPALGAVACAAGIWLDRRTAGPAQPQPDRPTADLVAGERAAWFSRASNGPLAATGGVLLVAGAVVTLVRAGAIGVSLVVVGLACLWLSTIKVSVGESGVRVAVGRWGWPARRIRLGKISAAHAERLRPLQVGGWGLRGLPGGSALMVRGGDCLVLEYRSGGRFVISVDDAARGAALLNGLLERAAVSSDRTNGGEA